MAAGQLWARVDVGEEHHWIAVVDDTGAVVLSRKHIKLHFVDAVGYALGE